MSDLQNEVDRIILGVGEQIAFQSFPGKGKKVELIKITDVLEIVSAARDKISALFEAENHSTSDNRNYQK